MNRLQNLLITFAIILTFAFLPHVTRAATLSFSLGAPQVYVGDVFTVQLNLKSAAEKINVADASVSFDSGKLEVMDIGTGGSIFAIWTRAPIYDNKTGKIMFTGGTTGNFSGTAGDVLTIVFRAKQKGQAGISFGADSALFLADGKGTQIHPSLGGLTVTVLSNSKNQPSVNQWDSLLAKDKTPPQNLVITLGKDPSVFDGKYFISFSADDSESGINYYAVKENGGNFVQTESPYVLNDQALSGEVTVKAVDKAGNQAVKTLALKQNIFARTGYVVWVIIAAVLLLLGLAIFKIKKHKK